MAATEQQQVNAAIAESAKEAAKQEAEKAAFKETLESSYPGLKLITVAGDGNCLFSAAADQVWGNPELHPTMRTLVMDYIDKNRGLIANSDDRNKRTEENYISDLRKTSGGIEIYGGRPELFALQEIFKRPVRVIVQLPGGHIGDDEEFLGVKDDEGKLTAPQIALSHEGGNHFNSLRGPHWVRNNLLSPGTVPDSAAAAPASSSAASSSEDAGSEDAGSEDGDFAAAPSSATAPAATPASGDGGSALHLAASEGNTETVQLLLEKGADINMKDKDENTALHLAAGYGQTETVQLLLEKGAKINEMNDEGLTALHLAASQGHTSIVKKLLNHRDADINIKGGNDGSTPLHLATGYGQTETVQLLLDRGADINAKSNIANTALHSAAIHTHPDIVKLLVNRGADINITNDNGKTALDDAPNDDIRQIIQQKKNPPIILPPEPDNIPTDEERVIVSLLASAASIIALLLQKQERETKEQDVAPASVPTSASAPIPAQDDSVAALLATLVPGIGTVATKVYVLPIDRNDMLYLINERGNGKGNRRLITKKDTGAIKDINLSNLSRLTPNAYYGKVTQLTYENQTTVDLQKAGEWIEGITDTTERAIVRKLLRGRNIKIEYSMPLWAKTILDNNTICESFKDRVRKAVRLSREKLAEDDTKKMKDLESLIMEGNPAIANVFQTERVLVTMDNTRRSHAFTVPNPYRASKVRNTYTDATFANPAGKPDPKDSMEKEVISRNTQLVQALIPKELYADKKITRAILEGLWYCGQHPDSRSHPGCFMARFLGELRGMQRTQGTDQVEKDAQRVVERTNKTLDLIQGIGMDIRTSIIIPPPSQGVRPLNK